MRRPDGTAEQLSFDLRRERRGGRREGAGRKPSTARGAVPHRRRPPHVQRHPLHVTLRAGLRGLRAQRTFAAILRAIAAATQAHAATCRVLHFSVQDDHVHLVVEARDARALSSGMRGLTIRVARGVNRVLRRRGRLFCDRYHARELTSPRAVRNALVYVLANHRKHRVSAASIDPCSSGAWLDGWREELATLYAYDDVRRLRSVPPAIARPSTWLASVGWRLHGAIGVDEAPAAPE